MAIATDTPKDLKKGPEVGGNCGGCTYVFNPGSGCYERQGTGGCSGVCRCALTICGLGSQIIQQLRPASMSSVSGISFNCAIASTDEKWIVRTLIDLAQQEIAAKFPMRRAVGLGAITGLVGIAIGFFAAMLFR